MLLLRWGSASLTPPPTGRTVFSLHLDRATRIRHRPGPSWFTSVTLAERCREAQGRLSSPRRPFPSLRWRDRPQKSAGFLRFPGTAAHHLSTGLTTATDQPAGLVLEELERSPQRRNPPAAYAKHGPTPRPSSVAADPSHLARHTGKRQVTSLRSAANAASCRLWPLITPLAPNGSFKFPVAVALALSQTTFPPPRSQRPWGTPTAQCRAAWCRPSFAGGSGRQSDRRGVVHLPS